MSNALVPYVTRPMTLLVLPTTPDALFNVEQHSLLQYLKRTPTYVVEFVLLYWHALNTVVLYGENYDVFYDACVEDWDQEFIRADGSEGDRLLHETFSRYADQYVNCFFSAYEQLKRWLPPLSQSNLYYVLHDVKIPYRLSTIALYDHNRQS